MSLSTMKPNQGTEFQISRVSDQEVLTRMIEASTCRDLAVTSTVMRFLFVPQTVSYGGIANDHELAQLLEGGAVSTANITFNLKNSGSVAVRRSSDNTTLSGHTDRLVIEPGEMSAATLIMVTGVLRKAFHAIDTASYKDLLDDAGRALFEKRDSNLSKLETMQGAFFQQMLQFTTDQEKKHQTFQQKLEADYSTRQAALEKEHLARLSQLEAREAELKQIRTEIDERDNRQARRDIYKDIKDKIKNRNTSFELTPGTKQRRVMTFLMLLTMLGLFAWGFYECFNKNVLSSSTGINWVAVGSQTAFALAFVGTATFFVRWSHAWFQRHADEEFKLKQLDLDIDRASWLVELAMEWKNITKTKFPESLVTTLSRNLFAQAHDEQITDERSIHPIASLLGDTTKVSVKYPTEFTVERGVPAKKNFKESKDP